MPAFPTKYANSIFGVVELLKRRLDSACSLTVTNEEFLDLFAPREHHAFLTTYVDAVTQEACNSRTFVGRTTLPTGRGVSLLFRSSIANRGRLIYPRNDIILPTAPSDLVTRVYDAVMAQHANNTAMNTVIPLFNWLNARCKTIAQMRFLWPTIITLCSHSDDLCDYGATLHDIRPPRTLPDIPPEVRAAFKQTADVVALASLLPAKSGVVDAVGVMTYTICSTDQINGGVLGPISGV